MAGYHDLPPADARIEITVVGTVVRLPNERAYSLVDAEGQTLVRIVGPGVNKLEWREHETPPPGFQTSG